MKKGKVISLSQIVVVAMVLMLGAAVWLNTKYSGDITSKKIKYMGESTLVNEDISPDAVATGAKAEEDYFTSAIADRENAYKQAEQTAQELLSDLEADNSAKQNAADTLAALAERKVSETKIESVLKAKGFQKCLAIISDTSVTVIVEAKELTASQTVQIQDAVTSLSAISLNNIKIITVEG